ncbi:ArdC family protein [Novosphingobium terrae]|uniref:ArdC family protein n=1 Tax=Novosphingobium terrae TaxID=2726189 RepID=UPI00197DCA38|nr:zincin-like metallopeptidase domain-containing protein [Novosphingobium terrae]
MSKRHDIYATVTAQIIAAIEAGPGKWRMPWHHNGAPVMRPTSAAGRRYSGINRVVLWATAEHHQFASGTWATYQQWKQHGAQVRKGEGGTQVIFWKKIEKPGADDGQGGDGAGDQRRHFFATSFWVFNQDQVDGVDETEVKAVAPITPDIAAAQSFLESLGVPAEYGRYDAHYDPARDVVFMPQRSAFDSDADLISTLAHEMVHASGHASRLARDTLRDYHRDRAIRSREELVADLGSAMLMADLGLASVPRPDHAAYLASWLTLLKHDPRAIFTAAAQAQAAADWIHAQAGSAGHTLPIAA